MPRTIIISDLHLNQGKQSPNEDFFYDEDFKNFLEHYGKKKTKLIITGDLIDFLQVSELDHTLFPNASKNERKFGLGTEEEKSAWKMRIVAERHPVFFQAIADFLKKGNDLVIIKGNHDIEFFWPRVQEQFIRSLSFHGISLNKIKKQLMFLPWFYYEKSMVYVEHGNQYDPINSFDHFLHPVLPSNPKQLWLAFGGFFVRYFFNKVEHLDPFADNIKPATRYVSWALRHHPVRSIRVFLYYFPFFLKVYEKMKQSFDTEKTVALQKENEQRILEQCRKFRIPEGKIRRIYDLHAKPVAGTRKFFATVLRKHRGIDFSGIARTIKKLLGVKYVVFGHTHYAGTHDHYLNTGTWTPFIFNSELDVEKAKKLTYVLIEDGKAELKEWK